MAMQINPNFSMLTANSSVNHRIATGIPQISLKIRPWLGLCRNVLRSVLGESSSNNTQDVQELQDSVRPSAQPPPCLPLPHCPFWRYLLQLSVLMLLIYLSVYVFMVFGKSNFVLVLVNMLYLLGNFGYILANWYHLKCFNLMNLWYDQPIGSQSFRSLKFLLHSGETKRKFESVYTGGTMNTPDSGKILEYWHCCGSEDSSDPGCTAAPHASYDDSFSK
nr:uncharacterized protein LOC109151351 [Ipomoea batatas]